MRSGGPNAESARLQSLLRHRLLDTEPEKEFDDIVEIATYLCSTPIGGITLLDSRRQWFKSQRGLTIQESDIEIAFCKYALNSDDVFIVPDAGKDSRFVNNPFVTASPHLHFYAGVPLHSVEGYTLGTLWVGDSVPRILSEQQIHLLRMLAGQVEALLRLKFYLAELHAAMQSREDALKKLAELERFIRENERRDGN